MNIKNLILILTALPLLYGSSEAQNAFEALRYGNTYQVGTARNIAVGGTMGALGADLSVLSTNPAGIARFKSTEFSLSPSIVFGSTDGMYLNNTLEDNHLKFNFSSGGAAFAKLKSNDIGWKGISFGFAINRLDHYNDNILLAGTNTNNSLLDVHASLANGTGEGQLSEIYPFDAGLSYLSYLINPDSNLNYSTVLNGMAPEQTITLTRTGGKYEAVFGGGGNYNDKLYVGASVGIPLIRFRETRVIREEMPNNAMNGFNYFEVQDEVRSLGYGANLKLGLLAKPHDLVRLGVAFHTPTFIKMEDAYLTVLYADYDTVAYEVQSPDGLFDYNLVTPWKLITDASVLLKEFGFFSVEYELQNPANAKFNFTNNSPGIKEEETIRNDEINALLTWQHHLKTGVEINLQSVRLRAGFQYRTSGIQGSKDHQLIYSGGVGYRGQHFFVDGAYSLSKQNASYFPYELGQVSSGEATLDRARSQVTITLGIKL